MAQMQARNTESEMQQRNGDGEHEVMSHESTDFYNGDSMQQQKQGTDGRAEERNDDVKDNGTGGVKDNGVKARENGAKTGANGENGAMRGGRRGGLVTCFGELLIDFVPTESGVSLADAPTYNRAPGGAPANVAVCVSRLGGRSAFVGKVGDDGFGHMLADILSNNAVNTEGIRYDANARTALAFVTLRADGEREFMFYRNPSADMLLREDELDADLIKSSAIFHYGSISLISEPCRTAHHAAMKIAKSAGCLLSYDANLRLQLWPSPADARRAILSVMGDADVIKVSEEEVAFLTKTGPAVKSDEIDIEALKLTEIDDGDALQLMSPSTKLLLVTEGSKGCRYYTQSFNGRVKSFSVKPVDTTGAGDAFMGAVLSQIAVKPDILENEDELREAIAFANACGAITTTVKGAIPALPNRDSVLKLLKQSNVEFSDRVLVRN